MYRYGRYLFTSLICFASFENSWAASDVDAMEYAPRSGATIVPLEGKRLAAYSYYSQVVGDIKELSPAELHEISRKLDAAGEHIQARKLRSKATAMEEGNVKARLDQHLEPSTPGQSEAQYPLSDLLDSGDFSFSKGEEALQNSIEFGLSLLRIENESSDAGIQVLDSLASCEAVPEGVKTERHSLEAVGKPEEAKARHTQDRIGRLHAELNSDAAKDASIRAKLQLTLGQLYSQQKQYSDSNTVVQQALGARRLDARDYFLARHILSNNHFQIGKTLIDTVSMEHSALQSLGRLDQAHSHLKKALTFAGRAEEAPQIEHQVAHLSYKKGELLQMRADTMQADLLSHKEKTIDPEALIRDYHIAEEHFNFALKNPLWAKEHTLLANHQLARTHHAIGRVWHVMAAAGESRVDIELKYKQAEAYHKMALDQDVWKDAHRADTQISLALVLYQLNKTKEAVPLLKAFLDFYKEPSAVRQHGLFHLGACYARLAKGKGRDADDRTLRAKIGELQEQYRLFQRKGHSKLEAIVSAYERGDQAWRIPSSSAHLE